MKLNESTLLQNYSQTVQNKEAEWTLPPTVGLKIIESLMVSIPELLAERLKTHTKAAVVIRDLSDVLILGAIAERHDSEDPNTPGNYSYVMTTLEEDLKEVEDITDITDPKFIEVAIRVADREHNMDFKLEAYSITLFRIAASTLVQWLDTNAREGEKVTLEHPGYFDAEVGVEDGEKIISIVPSGEMKQKLKSDSTMEK